MIKSDNENKWTHKEWARETNPKTKTKAHQASENDYDLNQKKKK